jgi:hypothetical protein
LKGREKGMKEGERWGKRRRKKEIWSKYGKIVLFS